MKNFNDLKQDFENEIMERIEEIKEAEYPSEIMQEIADSYLPIYTADALEYAISNLWLAVDEAETDEHNAYRCIVTNMYNALTERGYEILEKHNIEN